MVSYIWSAFIRLSGSRTAGFSGPNPISYTEIQAWANLTNQVLSPRDVEAIMKIDLVYLKVQNG